MNLDFARPEVRMKRSEKCTPTFTCAALGLAGYGPPTRVALASLLPARALLHHVQTIFFLRVFLTVVPAQVGMSCLWSPPPPPPSLPMLLPPPPLPQPCWLLGLRLPLCARPCRGCQNACLAGVASRQANAAAAVWWCRVGSRSRSCAGWRLLFAGPLLLLLVVLLLRTCCVFHKNPGWHTSPAEISHTYHPR